MGQMKELSRQRDVFRAIIGSALPCLKECKDLIMDRVALVEGQHWMLMQSTDQSIEEMEDYLGIKHRRIAHAEKEQVDKAGGNAASDRGELPPANEGRSD